ncbi:MAG: molybdate ABC transporter substrate-binding protein [Sandaracinaceae bacterium]
MRASPLAFALFLITLAACDADRSPTLTVLAASSLGDAFADLEAEYERAHPDVDVRVSLAGSHVLRLQIEEGAPADVFASADLAHADALFDQGLAERPVPFAHNRLVVIVPREGPSIARFEELDRAQRLVLGDPEVPAGRYARELLDRAAARYGTAWRARVMSRLVSEESNVRLVRAKVELGEADAAIVYASDAAGSDRVRAIEVPADLDVRADYAIAVLRRAPAHDHAEELVELVRGPRGRAALVAHGFTP